jgi:hypothetical protein
MDVVLLAYQSEVSVEWSSFGFGDYEFEYGVEAADLIVNNCLEMENSVGIGGGGVVRDSGVSGAVGNSCSLMKKMFAYTVTAQSRALLESAAHSAEGLESVAEEEVDLSRPLQLGMKLEMNMAHPLESAQARSLARDVSPARRRVADGCGLESPAEEERVLE